MVNPSPAGQLSLIGGELCLDFTNTVDDHNSDQPEEHLKSYADLLAWSAHVGVLSARRASDLEKVAAAEPARARAALEQAIALREALYHIFSALAEERRPRPSDLSILNEVLAEAMGRARVSWQGDRFAWTWADAGDSLAQMLHPVARSAAELLTSNELIRVRECSSEVCGWLFLDRTRNHSRRWCSMDSCGNRAKARRHYHRVRSEVAAAGQVSR